MIIDECKYTCDSHLVNSTELKEKYTYIHLGQCGEYDHCTHLVYYGIRIWYFSPSNASLWFLLLKQYRKGPKTKWLWLMGFESKTADPADLGCTFISPPIQDMSMSPRSQDL